MQAFFKIKPKKRFYGVSHFPLISHGLYFLPLIFQVVIYRVDFGTRLKRKLFLKRYAERTVFDFKQMFENFRTHLELCRNFSLVQKHYSKLCVNFGTKISSLNTTVRVEVSTVPKKVRRTQIQKMYYIFSVWERGHRRWLNILHQIYNSVEKVFERPSVFTDETDTNRRLWQGNMSKSYIDWCTVLHVHRYLSGISKIMKRLFKQKCATASLLTG